MTGQITCLQGELIGQASSDQIVAHGQQGRLRQARASRLAGKGHNGRDQLFLRISLVQNRCTNYGGETGWEGNNKSDV